MIGVHTPEFDVEHDLGNVRRAVTDLGSTTRSRSTTTTPSGRAFDNHYWPALYFVDAAAADPPPSASARAATRQSEMIVQQLLDRRPEAAVSARTWCRSTPGGVEAAADWASLWSPENYLGYAAHRATSPRPMVRVLRHPARLCRPATVAAQPMGPCSVTGRSSAGAIVLNEADGRIVYRFHARDLHLVMGPPRTGDSGAGSGCTWTGSRRVPPTAPMSTTRAAARVTQPRLYQLIRQPGPITERTFEITFLDPGVAGLRLHVRLGGFGETKSSPVSDCRKGHHANGRRGGHHGEAPGICLARSSRLWPWWSELSARLWDHRVRGLRRHHPAMPTSSRRSA